MQSESIDQANPNEMKDLTSALMSALGVKTSEEGEKVQSVKIFLSKLYHKYSPQAGKKFNQIKLNRLNGLLFKVCKDPPTESKDIEIVYQIIKCFLISESSSPIDEISFASNTCTWIAKFIEEVLAHKSTESAVEAIEILLQTKKANIMSTEEFDSIINESLYFKDKEINKEDEMNSNLKYTYRGFMSEFTVNEEILNIINVKELFMELYNRHEDKPKILDIFTKFIREVDIQGLKEIFIETFVNARVQTKETLTAILNCLDTELFTGDNLTEIVRLLLKTNDRKLFYSLPIKNLKSENRYLEILIEGNKPNLMDEMAETFIHEKQSNNYHLIYLINKSNQILSEKFITLPLDPSNSFVSNRLAIICSLSIHQNIDVAHNKILKHFFENENNLSLKQKLDCLRLAHYSHLVSQKSHLLTEILRKIPFPSLDLESNFEFLPKDNFEKIELDKNEREELEDFLSRHFGSTDEVYWIKLDLNSACGKVLACMQNFKKVQKIFEAPIENILAELPAIPENLKEVVLMGINNKLEEQYTVNQSNLGPVIQWGLETYKKEEKQFKAKSEAYLKKFNQVYLQDLALEVFLYNLETNDDLEIDSNIKCITSSQISHKLNGLDFSEYFMGPQPEKEETLGALFKSKNLLISLKKLLKLIKNDGKTQNRKELRTIVSDDTCELRALKIIKLLSEVTEKGKFSEDIKTTLEKLLKNIKPELENFKALSAHSSNFNIPYIPIFESLGYLVKNCYEPTIRFLAQLLKSKQVKLEEKNEKSNKKAKKNKSEEKQTKLCGDIIDNFEICFAETDPNSLSSYGDIILIIEEARASSNKQNFKTELVKWLGRIKMFHKPEYKEWKVKVSNYCKLWKCAAQIVPRQLEINEIERHFLMLIDLINTLYEKYKEEKDFLEIEKKLLNSLCILYSMASTKEAENLMDEEEEKDGAIPKDKLDEVLYPYQLPSLSIPYTLYCFDCSKKVCNECADVLHRHHDKNYVGLGVENSCHKMYLSKEKMEETKQKVKDKYIQKLVRNAGGELDLLAREREYDRLEKFFSEGLLPEKEKIESQKEQEEDDLEKAEIQSCSEKDFIIKSPSQISQAKKPIPTFTFQEYEQPIKNSSLNITPLLNLLMRELKSNSFFSPSTIQVETETKSLLLPAIEVEMSNEKYTLFRNEIFRSVATKNSSYFSTQDPNGGNFTMPVKKNVLAINDKFLAIISGNQPNQIHYLDVKTIKNKFFKRESEKKYKDNDGLEAYQIYQSKTSEPLITDIFLSPINSNLIVETVGSKIFFEQISRDGRNKLLAGERSVGGEITKFEWLKAVDLKGYYSYLSNELIIGKIGRKEADFKFKISIGKKIKDYCNSSHSQKEVVITLLDTDNKLYRSRVDILGKKHVNFIEHPINYTFTEPIMSICCQGATIYAVTQTGKIVIVTVNEQNNLISQPTTYPIVDHLKIHKIAETNLKFKEISRISKLRFVAKHQNEILLSCILYREDGRKYGFFSLISLNLHSKRSKLILFNDQGTTDSYDFISLNDKEFLFTCLQEDGEIWNCKHVTHSKLNNLNSNTFSIPLSLNDVAEYAEIAQEENIIEKIEFYSQDARYVFKENNKVTDHFKINVTDSLISVETLEKSLRAEFITGIEFGLLYQPEIDGMNSKFSFTLLGKMYTYILSSSREIQICFTIKDVLSHYLGNGILELQIIEGRTASIKDFTLFGIKWSEKSVYFDALNKFCKLLYIYKSPQEEKKEKVEKFLFNELKTDLKDIDFWLLESYFKLKQIPIGEQNLLLKLELFRQSLENQKMDPTSLYECFENIRNHILPNCERKELEVSAEKLCRKLNKSCTDNLSGKLGHILNYKMHNDIYVSLRAYKQFQQESTIDSYQDLLGILCKNLNTRAISIYTLLSMHPGLVKEISGFFRKVLVDYKIYFKINENGLDKEEKNRLMLICSNLMYIMIEWYQIQKNRSQEKTKNCEEEFLKILESIFCLDRKEIHRELKINPFQYLEETFEESTYTFTTPVNFLKLEEQKNEISMEPSLQEVQVSNEDSRNMDIESGRPDEPNINKEEEAEEEIVDDFGEEESWEEQKDQDEENREMEEEYAYEMQAQDKFNLMLDEEEENELDRLERNDNEIWKSTYEVDPEKIYQHLFSLISSSQTETMSFTYEQICENLLIELFSDRKYLSTENMVLYIGIVYNMLISVEKKLARLFPDGVIDWGNSYVEKKIMKIIQCIDGKIDSPFHSLLFLPLNCILASNQKMKNYYPKSTLSQCFAYYYKSNLEGSKLLECLLDLKWHPKAYKPAVSLSEVFRFEFFDTVNPIYQVKFVGNLYLNLRNQAIPALANNINIIKENMMKTVVKYKLRVYKNIMLLEGWTSLMEKTILIVAFEQLANNTDGALNTIKRSLGKDASTFRTFVESNPEKVSDLENLLGTETTRDELILDILNAYYESSQV